MKACVLIIVCSWLSVGCSARAPTPVFYPNSTYQALGPAAAEQAAVECRSRAKAHGAAGRQANPIGSAAGGALAGAAIGAAAGSVFGDAGRGAEAGAASGAVRGLLGGMREANRPDSVEQAFVRRCLAEQGYEVIGWR
nr:hypothetical protein [Oceanococcus sp. HetDA_MAG_MS8]